MFFANLSCSALCFHKTYQLISERNLEIVMIGDYRNVFTPASKDH